MSNLKDILQDADWKKEKHVPVIEAVDKAAKSDTIKVVISVGKEIPHPNTTEHHISYFGVFFKPDTDKFPYSLGRFEFNAHGASVQGPNTSTIYTEPKIEINFKTEKSGQIMVVSYCNIHGLWENSKQITVE